MSSSDVGHKMGASRQRTHATPVWEWVKVLSGLTLTVVVAAGLVYFWVGGASAPQSAIAAQPVAKQAEAVTQENKFYAGGSVFLKDQVTPACGSKEKFERLQEVPRGSEVFRTLLREAYASGECTYLPSLITIYIEELSLWSDSLRVRPKGSSAVALSEDFLQKSLWVSYRRVSEAIKD